MLFAVAPVLKKDPGCGFWFETLLKIELAPAELLGVSEGALKRLVLEENSEVFCRELLAGWGAMELLGLLKREGPAVLGKSEGPGLEAGLAKSEGPPVVKREVAGLFSGGLKREEGLFGWLPGLLKRPVLLLLFMGESRVLAIGFGGMLAKLLGPFCL